MASSRSIQALDVVALIGDLPEHHLTRGQVGTVVEPLAPGMFEVEFSDDDGRAYAMAPVPENLLLVLQYRPSKVA